MKTLIIGGGEIGTSLSNALFDEYAPDVYDIKDKKGSVLCENYEIMHICFPYSDKFVDSVKEYQNKFKPKYTVIHSTVPVGTSKKLNATHSPCVGIHPNLTVSMKTFTKFIGGPDASKVANYFRRTGMKVYLTDKAETTEFCKIQSTTFYSLYIEFFKDMKTQCDKLNIPFELWTLWINNYNNGYKILGCPEYTRPNLVPIMTKQGGHCTISNLDFINTPFTKFLKEVTNV